MLIVVRCSRVVVRCLFVWLSGCCLFFLFVGVKYLVCVVRVFVCLSVISAVDCCSLFVVCLLCVCLLVYMWFVCCLFVCGSFGC